MVAIRSRLWLYALATVVMAFLVFPTVIVIPMSFSASQYLEFPPREWSLRWYENYLGSAAWMQATATSIKAGILTAVVATPLGTLAAYGLFLSRLRAAALVVPLLLTPIIVPVTYPIPFTTETAAASNAQRTDSVSVSGMRLVDGVWYAQIVGATTNKENAYPAPGAAVYTVLSGSFDQVP